MRRNDVRVSPCLTRALAIVAIASAVSAAHDRGAIIYVDAAAPPGGDGASWPTAYDDLQEALGQASAGKEIWVATGLYTPAPPGGDRDISFQLKTGVALYGGFAGDEQFLDQRDWIANPTILSGDLNGDDGPQFQNYGENSYHVVVSGDVDSTAILDGFIITAGNADGPEDPIDWRLGGGMFNEAGKPSVLHCRFVANTAWYGAGMYNRSSSPLISACCFQHNCVVPGGYSGGAIRNNKECYPLIVDCDFIANFSDAGGAIANARGGHTVIDGCRFIGNSAVGPGGGIYLPSASASISNCLFACNSALGGGGLSALHHPDDALEKCTFLANRAELIGGAVMGHGHKKMLPVTDCRFIANESEVWGGAFAQPGPMLLVNCEFSRNSAGEVGGGFYSIGYTTEETFINCTFSRNVGGGLGTYQSSPQLINCVLWGNVPEQVVEDPDSQEPSQPSFFFCDVEGGWDGLGSDNIDADPLFVQAGADDLRLGFGSPCVNAGDTSAVPEDVVTDLAGNPRVLEEIVDMGAYEGEYEQLPPAAVEYDLDFGEVAYLIPESAVFDPLEHPAVLLINLSGVDDTTAKVTQLDEQVHPAAEGYSEVAAVLAAESTMPEGEFVAIVYLAFDEDQLGGTDPLALDLTYYDEGTGNWALAVSANAHDSVGYDGPIGDRIVVVGGDEWGLTGHYGDYGVFWDPDAKQGFVWARLDYVADFAVGTALCPADCAQPPDGEVRVEDLIFVLRSWERQAGPFDVNGDGTVDVFDLVEVLNAWGACP